MPESERKRMKKIKGLALVLAVMLAMMALPTGAMAHGAWFARRSDRIQLVCGEGWKDNAYDPNGLLEMKGYDAAYADVAVEPINGEDYLYIEPAENLAVVYALLDYGFWSNTPEGTWVPKPMDEVEGATIGTHAIKYSLNYLGNVDQVQPIEGLLYQFVPSVDPTKLEIGEEFTVQLLHNGEPMANVDIIPDVINHHTEMIKTDENGMATVKAANGGVNVIGCEMVVPYENEGVDQKATRSKAFVSLSFTLYPEEDE